MQRLAVLNLHPLRDGAQIVAQMRGTVCRLNTGHNLERESRDTDNAGSTSASRPLVGSAADAKLRSRAQCAHSGRMQLTRGACCGSGVAAVAVAVGAAVASARMQLAVIGAGWARRRAADAAWPPACRSMMEVAVSAEG